MVYFAFEGVDQDSKVTWLKDGKPVELDEFVYLKKDGDKQVLCISNATTEDVGEYTCVVENKSGKVQTSANLDITPLPSLTSKQVEVKTEATATKTELVLDEETEDNELIEKKKIIKLRKEKEQVKKRKSKKEFVEDECVDGLETTDEMQKTYFNTGEDIDKTEATVFKLTIDSFQSPTVLNEGENIEIKCHVSSKSKILMLA